MVHGVAGWFCPPCLPAHHGRSSLASGIQPGKMRAQQWPKWPRNRNQNPGFVSVAHCLFSKNATNITICLDTKRMFSVWNGVAWFSFQTALVLYVSQLARPDGRWQKCQQKWRRRRRQGRDKNDYLFWNFFCAHELGSSARRSSTVVYLDR